MDKDEEFNYSNADDEEDDFDDRLREVEDEIVMVMADISCKRVNPTSEYNNCIKNKRRRIKYDRSKLHFTNPFTMQRQEYTFEYSIWFANYVLDPNPENRKWSTLFRKRFRMPYPSFLDLADQCKNSGCFEQWSGTHHHYNKKRVTPLKLLLLCALRYLGRGWTFDDLYEATAINATTIRKFVYEFIKFGSTVLYNTYVCDPITSDDIMDCETEYKMAGFPGCVGSTDATHIMMEVCSYRLRQLHLGYKLAHTARTYNITVNHRRQILSTTKGHPSRFNDKTLVLYDDFVNKLKNGKYNDNHEFVLFDYGDDGEIIEVKHRGCYVIVDNGYLNWSVTVPPMKHTNLRSEIRFSEWLESLRKDVECTFGILKGRWRILKTGIRLHGILNCDMIWLTCCALHNMLLEIDGLASKWTDGVQSDWQTMQDDDVDMPNAIRKLMNPSSNRLSDLSNIGCGNDIDISSDENNVDESTHPDPKSNSPVKVQDLSMSTFRKRLIRHFNICFLQNKVIWSKRNN